MSSIASSNTKPELLVRKFLHSRNYRYRLHYKKLPGRPDIVFVARKISIFINGCFWHQHEGCNRGGIPSTNKNYWKKKLAANIERDKRNIKEITRLGWKAVVLWECDLIDRNKKPRNLEYLIDKIFHD